MRAINIQWDTDGDMEVLNSLPTEIEIPEGVTDTVEISDYISNESGFCHYGFDLVPDNDKEQLNKTITKKHLWVSEE